MSVDRDPARFGHMYADGRPQMPEDYVAPLGTKLIRTRIRERDEGRNRVDWDHVLGLLLVAVSVVGFALFLASTPTCGPGEVRVRAVIGFTCAARGVSVVR